ncbi:glycosyltransferase [Pediococcus acidilactici]
MKYFVSRGIYTFNSGTEHAQAQRTRLFNQQNDPAHYVTMDYNRFWLRDAQRVGLDSGQVLNMYDYFQGTTQIPTVPVPVRKFKQLPFDEYQLVDYGPDYYTVDHAGRQLARINILPGTVGLVGDVEYYDRFDNLVSRDNYDWRGFKSSTDYFHPDGSLGARRFLNPAGEVVLENVYMNVADQLQPTMWKLIDYHGKDYRFDSQEDLFLFFLNEIAEQDQEAVMVADHRDVDLMVMQVENAKSRWLAFHGTHVDRHGNIYAAYTPAFQAEPGEIDGIIVPTAQQQAVIQEQFPQTPVHVAADTVIDEKILAENVSQKKRTPGRIIFSGRLESDRRPDEALAAFLRLFDQLPEVTLEYRGYTNDHQLLGRLKQMAQHMGIAEHVIFGDYLTDSEMNDFHNHAQVLINTSFDEAGGISVVEAMAHRVPVVAYYTDYGIEKLVQNNVSGFVVTNGDQAQMARRVKQILQDPQLWQKLSEGAQQTAQAYQAKKVYQQWKNILG